MSDVKALFGLIDKRNKRRLIGAVICCVLSVLCGILPYLGVWGIVTCFLDERTENLFQYVCLIAAAIILKHLLFGTGTKISHKVAYQTLGETRKKLFRKIARLPMGYVKTTASGQVKTIIMDNMEQLETFYAHNIPEIISGLAVPLCMEILLVILDIRVAGIMLIPVVLFILVGILMIIVQMKKMDEFNQAFADVSVKTVEYVNGMKELKIFAADESTYGRLSESIRTYSTVVTEWFQSCLKYVAFNHTDLNSNLVFLFPLAGLMYLSGSVTAASYIMYLFMGLAMLIPEDKIAAATAMTSCGIAYVLKYIQAAMQAGIEMGIYPKDGMRMVAQSVKGAAELILNNDTHPSIEIDKVCTPGGITIKGINELERQGFPSAIINAIKASK